MTFYKEKYLKYKNKYLELKSYIKQLGGPKLVLFMYINYNITYLLNKYYLIYLSR
jgi:hypothetical protein